MFFLTSTGGLVIIGAALPKNGYEYLIKTITKIIIIYNFFNTFHNKKTSLDILLKLNFYKS